MRLKLVEEGGVKLKVPDVALPEEGEVFYNPEQALSRDISLLLYASMGVDVLDGMAGTGARAVRLARHELSVVANDRSEKAAALIKKNARLNGVELEVMCGDLRVLLHSRRFGAVDIDPFGSPAPFVHCAFSSAIRVIGVAATDTAALAGTYPRVGRRRYGVQTRKLPNYPEIGIRALAGFVVREGAKLEVAARPVFAHAYRHCYRLYFSLKRGAGASDRLLGELGSYEGVGPIYKGNLWDPSLVKGMVKMSRKVQLAHPKTAEQLRLISEELKFPRPYYDVHALCRGVRSCPSMEKVLEATGGVRTHFSPTGFRCDLGREELERLLAKI